MKKILQELWAPKRVIRGSESLRECSKLELYSKMMTENFPNLEKDLTLLVPEGQGPPVRAGRTLKLFKVKDPKDAQCWNKQKQITSRESPDHRLVTRSENGLSFLCHQKKKKTCQCRGLNPARYHSNKKENEDIPRLIKADRIYDHQTCLIRKMKGSSSSLKKETLINKKKI